MQNKKMFVVNILKDRNNERDGTWCLADGVLAIKRLNKFIIYESPEMFTHLGLVIHVYISLIYVVPYEVQIVRQFDRIRSIRDNFNIISKLKNISAFECGNPYLSVH